MSLGESRCLDRVPGRPGGAISWLGVVALVACATPRAADSPRADGSGGAAARPPASAASPGSAAPAAPGAAAGAAVPRLAGPAPPVPEVSSPAEAPDPYALVRDDPAVAAAAADLVAAAPDARPAALMRRARAALVGARKLRAEMGGPFGGAWPPAEQRFLAYCELATRDLDELLATHPRAPEAAEALFTLGQVNDFPLLNRFDDALAAYRRTVQRFPDTPWGRQARERIAVIERNLAPATRGGGTPGN